MDRLAKLGVGLAIDDFGTGYSSLAALRQLPVNQLKIDRSFVMEMSTSPDDDAIVSSAVTLGRSHGLVVVAEGVETEQAWRQLAELGCHLAQGYHISRPLPEPEITRWLQAREALARQIELLAQV
jgi:diguanylate cyclase